MAPLGRRALLRLAGAATVTACGITETAPASTDAPKSPIAAAPTPPTAAGPRPLGRITVYTALDERTNSALVDAFTRRHAGAEVELVPLAGAGDLQTRIITERASPRADVFLGGSSELHDVLGAQGLLEPYRSPSAKDLPDVFKHPGGLWAGWCASIVALAVNVDRLKNEPGGKQPATWDDLLDPAWRAAVALPDPRKTTAGYAFLATQVFRFDRDEGKALDYLKRLHGSIARYAGTAREALALVSKAEVVGAAGWSHDILAERAKSPVVELATPSATGFEISAVSIVKGARNQPLARAFVDWMLTPDAGALAVRLTDRHSTFGSVPPPAGAPPLSQVQLVRFDRFWATDNKDRLLKLFDRTVGPAA